jgi:lipopolysaccharide/colanic/teichoic acid biosynthesis glycosyltransferase
MNLFPTIRWRSIWERLMAGLPRPKALFCGIIKLKPGITGWAQINGRDDMSIHRKVQLDAEYLQRQSLSFDLKILWITALKVVARDGVVH